LFENLNQLVENAPLVVLGARLKIFFQYLLRFADRPKRQLLISIASSSLKRLTNEADSGIKSVLRLSHQFLFLYEIHILLWPPLQAQNVGRFPGV
jgi:hypothetical protein